MALPKRSSWNKGLPWSESSRHKMSLARKGKSTRPCSEETKHRIGLANKGKPNCNKGKHLPPEVGRKISATRMGHGVSEEQRKKQSMTMKERWKNQSHPMLGKPRSEETKLKLKLANLGKHHSSESIQKIREAQRLEKNAAWLGGKSYEPYSVDWTETFKRSIRERDHYICQICGKPQGDVTHNVHHIDYDKKNCSPDNLITLCVRCHVHTNCNREHWKSVLKGRKQHGITAP